MLCDRAAGRQLIHALTEPAHLVKRVQLPHAHLSDGKIGGHMPELLHPHERNRAVCERSSPKASRDGSHVLRMYYEVTHQCTPVAERCRPPTRHRWRAILNRDVIASFGASALLGPFFISVRST